MERVKDIRLWPSLFPLPSPTDTFCFSQRNLLIGLKGSFTSRRDNTGGKWGREGRAGS